MTQDKETIRNLLDNPEYNMGDLDDKTIQSTFDSNIIPFESTVYFGENEQFKRNVKAGDYLATKIYRKGINDYAMAYINIDDWKNKYNQDINAVMNDIDVTGVGYVDGGEYGVMFGERSEECFGHPSQYHFHDTNYGDGGFIMYENKDASVFVMDDMEIIAGQELLFKLHDINEQDTYIELYWEKDTYTYTFYDEDDKETKMIVDYKNSTIREAMTQTLDQLFNQAKSKDFINSLDDLKETDLQR